MIDIRGLDKVDVLIALYEAARPQGLGHLHYDPAPMSRGEAEALLKGDHYFDYLKGRVMKVQIKGDQLNPALYDRDNGAGAAERALAPLREVTT